jgi:hypothetical protein
MSAAKSPADDNPAATAAEVGAPRRGALAGLRRLLQRSGPRPGWRWAHALYRVALAGAGLTALIAGVRLPLADYYRAIGADPETQAWWRLCGPCQVPLASRQPGEHWAAMAPVFHVD